MTYLLDWTKCLWNGQSYFDGDSTSSSYSTSSTGECGTTSYEGTECGYLSGGSHGTQLDVEFQDCLQDVSFSLYDVDLSDCGPGKLVDIQFFDASGNPIAARFELVDGVVKVFCDAPCTGFQISNNADDCGTDIKFSSISCALAPSDDADGIVEGTSGNDLIDYSYTGDPNGDMVDHNDALLPGEVGNDDIIVAGAGDDTVLAGAGNDLVYGGSGNDVVEGGDGNDVIYGDSTLGAYAQGPVVTSGGRESFEWDKAPDPGYYSDGHIDNGDSLGGFTQDTGNVSVSFSKTTLDGSPRTTYSTDQQVIQGIDGGSETVDSSSALRSYLNENNESAKYNLAFSAEVYNVDFRISDLDTDSKVIIKAFDAAGNEVPIQISAGGDIAVSNSDGLVSDDTLLSKYDTNQVTSNESTSALIEIAGPVARIEIIHTEDGSHASAILISDVFYDTGTPIVAEASSLDEYDDILDGGAGDDVIYGQKGDDTITGGEGDDKLYGGGGSDTISGGNGNDVIYGDDTAAPADGNYIVNGSFENVTGLVVTGYGYIGDSEIPGWTSNSTTVDIDVHNDSGHHEIVASDGENWLDLDSSPSGVRVGQDVQGLQPGETYVLTFDVNDSPLNHTAGDPQENLLKVYWGGELIATIDPYNENGDTTWETFSFNLTAGSGNGSNRLEFEGTGQADNFGIAVDNVGLVAQNPQDPEEPGNDIIDGGAGDDIIHGGDGNDSITGGAGVDKLFGDYGSDTFYGGNGGDVIVGGEDPDDGDIDVLDLRGSSVDFVTYDADDHEKGVVTFLDGSTMSFSEIENVIPCFTPGTMIATPKGERPVEELRVGDRVITRDNGIQEIAWVGQKDLTFRQLEENPHLKPVLIKAGSLGNDLPERDMIVSPNHRVLVASDRTQLYFEEREVLAAAKHLVGSNGIVRADQPNTRYIHFMFERHEVVLSNGAWTESFQPGDYSLKGIGNGSRDEIFELFPELRTRQGIKHYSSARRSLKRHEAQLLVR